MGIWRWARAKRRVFDRNSSVLASGPIPLAESLQIVAEALMNNEHKIVRMCRKYRQLPLHHHFGVSLPHLLRNSHEPALPLFSTYDDDAEKTTATERVG